MHNTMTNEELGRWFGYPECCIKWFMQSRIIPFPNVIKLTKKQEEVHGFRGFIPCPSCAEKVTHDTLHTLIKNRQCPEDFPNA